MVEEVLVKESLSTQEIAAGEELLSRLRRAGIKVVAAYWLRPAETGSWLLDIVTPAVDKEGPLKVYEKLHELVSVPKRIAGGLDINIINVLGLNYSFFKNLKLAIRSAKELSGVRLPQFVVGDSLVDLYIYKFPATENSSNEAPPSRLAV